MLKCSSERWVCAPHSLSAGTSTTPRLSVSFLVSAIDLSRASLFGGDRRNDSAAGARQEGVLRTRLQHHVGAPPRLIVEQAPLVAGADMVLGDQDIAGSHDERLVVAGGEFERSRQCDHVLRLRGIVPIERR